MRTSLVSVNGVGLLFFDKVLVSVLGERELSGLLLSQESQVQYDLDEVALSVIVVLVFIIVNDVLFTVIHSGGEVLEVVQVKRISKDVVAMDTVDEFLALEGLLIALEGVVGEHLEAEVVSGIFLFRN